MYDGVFFLHNYKMIEFLASNYKKHIIHIEMLNIYIYIYIYILQILRNYEWLCITFISKHFMLVALTFCSLFFLIQFIYDSIN
jgi:hypothetical protein